MWLLWAVIDGVSRDNGWVEDMAAEAVFHCMARTHERALAELKDRHARLVYSLAS